MCKVRSGTAPSGNLLAVLLMAGAWRPCATCGGLTLYIDSDLRTDTLFLCGLCVARRQRAALVLARQAFQRKAVLS